MRFVLAAAFLAAWPSFAQSPYLTGDALLAAIKDCLDGCIVLNPASVAALEAAVQQFAAQAYLAGKHEGASNCRL